MSKKQSNNTNEKKWKNFAEMDAAKTKAKEDYAKAKQKFGKKKVGKEYWDDTLNKDRRADNANDWSWYVPNQQMLRDTASLPFGIPLGTRNNFSVDVYESTLDNYSVPGVMKVNVTPTFGWSENAVSPINVASRNIYTEIRHANSGHSNYDSPDLMLYLMAMDSTYSFHAWMKRLYGTLMCYSNQNRYLPQALVTAMGADFSDLIQHINDLRAYINYYALRCGTTCIPNDVSYYWKHEWMYSHTFCDSTNPKAQVYVTAPRAFYKFSYDDDGAGMLMYYPFEGNYTFADIVGYGDSLLAPIINNEDFAIMSGDILKAKGDAGVKKLENIAENYVCIPVYEETFNYQIQNATLVGEAALTGDDEGLWDLVQSEDKGWLRFTPRFEHSSTSDVEIGMTPYFTKRVLNFEHENVEPWETMDATRWMNVAQTGYYGSNKSISYKTIASEVVNSIEILLWEEDDGDWTLVHEGPYYLANTCMWNTSDGRGAAVVSLEKCILCSSLVSNFRFHPFIELNGGMKDDTDPDLPIYLRVKTTGLQGDVGYYTIVDEATLENMARVALFTMFNLTSHVLTK